MTRSLRTSLLIALAILIPSACGDVTGAGDDVGEGEGVEDFTANPHNLEGIFANALGAFIYFDDLIVKVCVPAATSHDYDWEWVDEKTVEGYGPDGVTVLQYEIEFVSSREIVVTPITTAATHNPATYKAGAFYPCDDGIGIDLTRKFAFYWRDGEKPDNARVRFNGQILNVADSPPETCPYTLEANDVRSTTDTQRMYWKFEGSWTVCYGCAWPGGGEHRPYEETMYANVGQLKEDNEACNYVRFHDANTSMGWTVNP